MTERIVTGLWWLLVTGFIAASGMGAAYLCLWGVGQAIAGRWEDFAGAVVLGIVVATCTWLACRHRGDLLYG
jgi:hypothetical protein